VFSVFPTEEEQGDARCTKRAVQGSYDCVDRIVLNAYFRMGHSGGGFRAWWQKLEGSEDHLDNAHLIRLAGRCSRRLRAFAQGRGIPVIDCRRGEKKHQTAEEYLATQEAKPGLFLIMVAKAPAPVWEGSGKHHLEGKKPMPYVNHYSFHIWDREWGHALRPDGFTASEVAEQVRSRSGQTAPQYGARCATYDLKKFRAKQLVRRIGSTRRYEAIPEGLRTLTALLVLRDKVIKPLLAAAGKPPAPPRSQNPTPIDTHYQTLRLAMHDLLTELGVAA
jgi:hypothetical protein